MLFIYLRMMLVYVLHFILPQATIAPDLQIDINQKCPACGNRQGSIRTVMTALPNGKPMLLVRHNCALCAAHWFQQPISDDEDGSLYRPAGG